MGGPVEVWSLKWVLSLLRKMASDPAVLVGSSTSEVPEQSRVSTSLSKLCWAGVCGLTSVWRQTGAVPSDAEKPGSSHSDTRASVESNTADDQKVHFIPKGLDGFEVRVLCRPVKISHQTRETISLWIWLCAWRQFHYTARGKRPDHLYMTDTRRLDQQQMLFVLAILLVLWCGVVWVYSTQQAQLEGMSSLKKLLLDGMKSDKKCSGERGTQHICCTVCLFWTQLFAGTLCMVMRYCILKISNCIMMMVKQSKLCISAIHTEQLCSSVALDSSISSSALRHKSFAMTYLIWIRKYFIVPPPVTVICKLQL